MPLLCELAVTHSFAVVRDGVPAGHTENSPAIHGWEEANAFKPSPGGTVERFSRPSGTRDLGRSVFPALKRWAIVARP